MFGFAQTGANAWTQPLLEANPWLQGVAGFGAFAVATDRFFDSEAFAVARRLASRRRLLQGPDVWNRWARAMLALRPRLPREPEAQLAWSALAGADFRCAEMPADCGGLVFPGLSRFAEATWKGDAYFTGAHFMAETDFCGARFGRDAFIENAAFSGPASFAGATFQGDAQFRHARFAGAADLSGATFARCAWFRGSAFAADADFSRAVFSGDAGLGDCRFEGGADFSQARFEDMASFEDSRFARSAGFAETIFRGKAWLNRVSFADTPDFSTARFCGGVVFDAAPLASGRRKSARPVNTAGMMGLFLARAAL